ncbi:uncharacterized protein LOC126680912 isoform X1 [Mercurialis annua]|uniref:uncharacterized protein LOC126680912 isoform X1 n=1 Tax=Mercurialis annua TaxID=3986 RepID=UPI00215E50BF|nr:uncharacterized protein LOC126680912 isoform X1 [Mercurialis annua]
MNSLVWNCRGLNNPRAVQVLRDLILQVRPVIVFLIETISSKVTIERIGRSMGFTEFFVVESVGRSGGLAFMWKDMDAVSVLGHSHHHIDLRISSPVGIWRLTGFYGYPERHRRRQSWNLLRSLSMSNNLPWCCLRDFNDLLSSSEKFGSVPHPSWLFDRFRKVVIDANLSDLKMFGHRFT